MTEEAKQQSIVIDGVKPFSVSEQVLKLYNQDSTFKAPKNAVCLKYCLGRCVKKFEDGAFAFGVPFWRLRGG